MYTITATLVDSGTTVHEDFLTVVGNEDRSVVLHMEQYSCTAVRYSVTLYGKDSTEATLVHTLPSCMYTFSVFVCVCVFGCILADPLDPDSFEKEVEAEVTFRGDGSLKHIEIKFTVRM